ncbi:hypothetical protein F4803DRAFT_549829 [Xylaria telfairii]|nr:hypothetical protein F4803DRAFT_549829 [Xylaria telfairii]
MPPKKKQRALPRAGRQKANNHKDSVQHSTAAPESTLRRSKRIELVKARKASSHKPRITENPSRTARGTGARRGRPRKSYSGRIGRSPIRRVGRPRDRDSVTAPNLLEQNQITTGRIQEKTRQEAQETGAPTGSQEVLDIDSNSQRSRICSRLNSWLEEVRVSPVTDVEPFFLNWRRLGSGSDMALSTSYSTEGSVATTGRQSTVKTGKKENAEQIKKVSLAEGLRTRLVEFEERMDDPKTAELKEVIVPSAASIRLEQTVLLRDKIKSLFSKVDEFQSDTSIYDIMEELSDAINDWKSTAHMAAITNRDFDKDLKHCKYPSNEALFQRTVLMSILNRHQISDKFDFNCEGTWSLRSSCYALPSTEKNSIPSPKPDLAIFCGFNSLVGRGPYWKSTPIPDDLKFCMSPDGYIQRCFPFIFIEAKKGFHDLTPALMANMHSASQALFNIFVWMRLAGHQTKFFSDVRLFSIAINAEKFALRVHRAQAAEEGEGLEFYYDDVCDGHAYKRDHICNLIRNVLVGYAEKTLINVLKESVETVLRNERQIQALKRKGEVAGIAVGDPLSNKKTTMTTSNQIAGPSESFGLSQVVI